MKVLMNKKEQNIIIQAGRAKSLDCPIELRIEQYFKKIVEKQPGKVALIYSDKKMTYLELDTESDRMAAELLRNNIESGDYVGLCLDRSFDLLVSILAILKIGATYIPMDKKHPEDRLLYTCSNSNIKALITDLRNLKINDDILLIHPDKLKKSNEQTYNKLHSFKLSIHDPAYVIYTSGSTGRPKGVAVTHKNLVSLIEASKDYFKLSDRDIWTFFHSPAFDFTVWEIWGSLLSGSQLVIIPENVSKSPSIFCKVVKENKVTILNQTPSGFSQFIHTEKKDTKNSNLRLVLLGGEQLETAILKPWIERYPLNQCKIENMYGITETTVISTSKNITEEDILNRSKSIGRPLPGSYIYILDKDKNIQPIGKPGEIYIGGEGVALGYINKTNLTRERYINDPYQDGIIYKSGDRGLLLNSGEIEFLGRLDNQIKIRGFRIELDEIRSVLLDINEIRNAYALIGFSDQNDLSTARIDSYIVLNSDISIEAINSYIKMKLPHYMIPSSITMLKELPTTHSGKVDEKKLREITITKNQSIIEKDNIDSAKLIKHLIAIWEKTLNCPVSENDNFFDLGGNSTYAIQLSDTAANEGLPQLTIKNIYTNQSINKIVLDMLKNN